jgi:MEMO1 family protein
MKMNVRYPSVAGSFYPGTRERLLGDIEAYLRAVTVENNVKDIIAYIVPHAGYVYSGSVAAWSYGYLKKEKPETVIVAALSHRYRFDGASVMPEGFYRTPLGDMEVHKGIAEDLLGREGFSWLEEADREEHSLEVQVPFIQHILPEAAIVPVTVGTSDPHQCRILGEGLFEAISGADSKTALVISTDLSHFYSHKEAEKKDRHFIDSLKSLDPEVLYRSVSTGISEACGIGPVLTGLHAALQVGCTECIELQYSHSGHTSGDMSRVVGYLAALLV